MRSSSTSMATKKRSRVVISQGTLASKIFERWARPGDEMPLERLESELPDERRYDIVAALRALEKGGAGEFTVGKKGSRSSFVWSDKGALHAARQQLGVEVAPAAAAKNAGGNTRKATATAATPPAAPMAVGATKASAGLLEHAFYVRPGVLATFRLPVDISRQEIERLCQLLQSVPFV